MRRRLLCICHGKNL